MEEDNKSIEHYSSLLWSSIVEAPPAVELDNGNWFKKLLCLVMLVFVGDLFSLESYIIYNEAKGKIVMEKHSRIKVDPSSLLKPFLAAYLIDKVKDFNKEENIFCPGWKKKFRKNCQLQQHNCANHSYNACWLKKGHRFVDLEHGVAYSCNYYFYSLAQRENVTTSLFSDYLKKRWRLGIVLGDKLGSFIGEALERPPPFTVLLNSYRRIWQSATREEKYQVISSGLKKVLSVGTLSKFKGKWLISNSKKPIEFIVGKTGTSGETGHALVILYLRINKNFYWILYRNKARSGAKLANTKLFDFLSRNYLRLAYAQY